MIVLALWLMRLGLREDRTLPFTAGVLYFLLWTLLRYVDLFAGVGGMLGAAVLFLLCGVGLLAVARFWLHRKETRARPLARGAGGEAAARDASGARDALTLPPGRGAGNNPLHRTWPGEGLARCFRRASACNWSCWWE